MNANASATALLAITVTVANPGIREQSRASPPNEAAALPAARRQTVPRPTEPKYSSAAVAMFDAIFRDAKANGATNTDANHEAWRALRAVGWDGGSAVRPKTINPYWAPPHLCAMFFRVYAAMLRRLPHATAQDCAWSLVNEYLDEIVRGPDMFERTADGEASWRAATNFTAQPPKYPRSSTTTRGEP